MPKRYPFWKDTSRDSEHTQVITGNLLLLRVEVLNSWQCEREIYQNNPNSISHSGNTPPDTKINEWTFTDSKKKFWKG